MTYNSKKNKQRRTLWLFIITTLVLTLGIVITIYLNNASYLANDNDQNEVESDSPTKAEVSTEETRPNSEVLIAAIGDIMFHGDQLKSAYNSSDNSYDFKPMFADVKPLLTDPDMTIANFETTLAGASHGYSGFPLFNSPDEVADAILDSGVDILTTANNHSLDTNSDGVKRTVNVLREKGFQTVGTYAEEPSSRVLVHEVNDITFGILSYTESTNGLGDQYSPDELDAMINLMTKENIERDINDAKRLDVDFIISFMHWGEEYMSEPNDKQLEYAQFMAENGVDLILGSHPHVIQKTDTIKTEEHETFVIYSMGNFISNQRAETLGENFARTEDGIIIYFNIEKDHGLDETRITAVDFIPTWVYRANDSETNRLTYRVLPIADFLSSSEIDDSFKVRMERSYEETMSLMSP